MRLTGQHPANMTLNGRVLAVLGFLLQRELRREERRGEEGRGGEGRGGERRGEERRGEERRGEEEEKGRRQEEE